MVIFEDKPGAPWQTLTDPEVLKKRVELVNHTPTYILVHARKVSNVNIFEESPQQSDYSVAWDK